MRCAVFITLTACLVGWPIGTAAALELRQTKWPACRALTNGDFAHTIILKDQRVFVGRGCPESWDNGQGGTEHAVVFDRIRILNQTAFTAVRPGLSCSATISAPTTYWDCK